MVPILGLSRSKIIALLFLCQLTIINICSGDQFSLPLPRAIVSEYYGNPYYENIRALGVPRNSEIVVGENTSKEVLKLLFECSADYPLQWTFTGDGTPEILTDTNANRGQINSIAPGDFGASLSIAKLTEAHTGNYTCRGIHNRNQLVSFYLFVPGSRIFTSTGGDNITITYSNRGDTTVRIPCGVSHPDAHVTLQRAKNGYLNCPLNDSLSFDPKTGFTMRINNYLHQDPTGTYICTASYQNTYRLIQFQLIGRREPFHAGSGPGVSSCYPSPCGQNAECRVNQRRAICSCFPGFVGDPFIECRRGLVGGSSDACHPSPCGNYGDCVIRHGLAACTCKQGYQGKPPHCTPSTKNQNQSIRCHHSQDCPQTEPMCIDRTCTNPCDPSRNRCGNKAECHLINRTPICSCPEGYLGDAYQECYLSEEYLPKTPLPPYSELEERLRPECQHNAECPPSLSCIHQRCQNPCPSVCGQHNRNCEVQNHRAICTPTALLPNCHPSDFNCKQNRNRLAAASSPPPNHPAPGGCHRISCGPHSECHDRDGQGICNCLPGHTGTPPECSTICVGNSGCPTNKACHARKCFDPCEGHSSCGVNSKCVVVKHKPECQCLNGYFGDPKIRCNIAPGTLLEPLCLLRCGEGAKCHLVNGKQTCKCLDPYDRECIRRIQAEIQAEPENCFSDQDCSPSKSCFNGKCKNPCEVFSTLCGSNQECRVANHKSECTCKPGFPFRVNNDCFAQLGNGNTNERSFDQGVTINDENSDEDGNQCEPPFCRRGDFHDEKHRCRFSGDCPSHKMCINSVCTDICAGGRACGVNAECRVVNKAPKCSCPTGFFGSPKIRCYPLYRHVKDGGDQDGGGKDIILLSNPEASVGANEESTDLTVANSTSLLLIPMNDELNLGAENSTLTSATTEKSASE